MALVLGLLDHAAIELQPGQLAVVEARRPLRHRRGGGLADLLLFLQSGLWRAHSCPSGARRYEWQYCHPLGTEDTIVQQQDEGLVAAGTCIFGFLVASQRSTSSCC